MYLEVVLKYRADLTAGSLKVAESRIVADLLLKQADDAAWKYVVKLQGKFNASIEQLESDIAAATSHRKKLEKEHSTLIKQRTELQVFDEKLRHYADKRIELDDGVKVNYTKFGDLLAEVKAITGDKPIVEVKVRLDVGYPRTLK